VPNREQVDKEKKVAVAGQLICSRISPSMVSGAKLMAGSLLYTANLGKRRGATTRRQTFSITG
jgi:hypothetical protein